MRPTAFVRFVAFQVFQIIIVRSDFARVDKKSSKLLAKTCFGTNMSWYRKHYIIFVTLTPIDRVGSRPPERWHTHTRVTLARTRHYHGFHTHRAHRAPDRRYARATETRAF
jgi:hypothetical protein